MEVLERRREEPCICDEATPEGPPWASMTDAVSVCVHVCLGCSGSNQPQKFGSDPPCAANRDLAGK